MNTWIILIRGINVGGRNVLRMKDLAGVLESAGLQDIQTYIQSGNVVCRSRHKSSTAVSKLVSKVLKSELQTTPGILILSASDLCDAVAECPFESCEEKTVHFFFLSEASIVAETRLNEIASETEQWHLTERAFFLHAPDGIGRSRLANNAEKLLGVTATARNLKTVRKLMEMSRQAEAES